jgi:general secretion pathway protein I
VIDRPTTARRALRGFTLLEVMVALALLAAAFMALADLGGNALRNYGYARDLTTATLLARGKMAELEDKFEDEGFKDFDQEAEGDFADQGRPEYRWQAKVSKPTADLKGGGLMRLLEGAGVGGGVLSALGIAPTGEGGAGAKSGASGSAATGAAPGGGGGPTAGASPMAGEMTKVVQSQLTAFGEKLDQSVRELTLTVSWMDGRVPHDFSVSTHLVVVFPKAPGGARGDSPDIAPGALQAAGATAATSAALGAATGGTPGATPTAPGTAPAGTAGLQGAQK